MIQYNNAPPAAQHIAQPVYDLIDDLTRILPIYAGERLTPTGLLRSCILACAERQGLFAVSDSLIPSVDGYIHPTTFGRHLREICSLSRRQLEERLQPLFHHQAATLLPATTDQWVAAADYHEIDYYVKNGDRSGMTPYLVRRPKRDKYGNRTKGSRWCFNYLTTSIVRPWHMVIGTQLMAQTDLEMDHFPTMASNARNLGVSLLLIDRGFYSYNLINWFETESGMAYLMPVPRTKATRPRLEAITANELNRFKGTFSEFFLPIPHQVTTSSHGTPRTQEYEMKVVVTRPYMEHRRSIYFSSRDQRVRKAFSDPKVIGFATNDPSVVTAKNLNDLYQLRWRIETGYRQTGQLMATTNAQQVNLRIFWFNLACLLENIWEWAHHVHDTTMYQFKQALRYICENDDDRSLRLLAAESRRRYNLDFIQQLATKKNGELASRQKASPPTASSAGMIPGEIGG